MAVFALMVDSRYSSILGKLSRAYLKQSSWAYSQRIGVLIFIGMLEPGRGLTVLTQTPGKLGFCSVFRGGPLLGVTNAV